MTDSEHPDLADTALLDEDTIPNDNQTHHCLSCDEAFTGVYCKNCGQKNDNYRRSLTSLLIELGATLTALEGRIWRTWGALLFKPGKVAREYADGARTKWSSPIRTYLAMSLILFGFMAITNTHIMSLDVNVTPKEGVTKARDELTANDLTFAFSIHMLERQSQIDARNETRDLDLIKRKIIKEDGTLNLDFAIGGEDDAATDDSEASTNEPSPANAESLETSNGAPKADITLLNEGESFRANGRVITTDENGQLYIDGEPVEGQRVTNVILEFMQNPVRLTDSFRELLPRLLFFMMPLTMYIGAIFIRGRGNAMLYDHIIHAAYIHSLLFFLLFIGLLASYVLSGTLVAKVIFISMLIYLPLSLKRMFARGWLKTIWTSYGVGFIYSIILMIGLAFILTKGLSNAAA